MKLIPVARTSSDPCIAEFSADRPMLRRQLLRRRQFQADHPFCVAVRNDSGQIGMVEFWITDHVVSICYRGHRAGALNRIALYHWLADPTWNFSLINADVAITFTRPGGIALTLPGLVAWRLPGSDVAELRRRLMP